MQVHKWVYNDSTEARHGHGLFVFVNDPCPTRWESCFGFADLSLGFTA